VATRLERAPGDLAPGHDLWLKREDEHDLGAFKWRAALPVVRELVQRGAPAVVTASTGNHGVATAWACGQANVRAIVYAPEQASAAKVELLRGLAAEVRFVDGDLDDAKARARADAGLWGLPFFEDGAEPLQYEAYGSIGDELAEQLPSSPAAVVVPVGNCALLAGVGRAIRRHFPNTLRVGVVAKQAPVMADSWDAGRPVTARSSHTIADGLAVRVAIPAAVEALRDAADRMLRVSERELAEAMGALARAGIRVEAGAAAPLAALRQLGEISGPVVLLVSGRNVDDELWHRAVNDPSSFPA
jgi:threonine dehydratase